MYRLHPKLVFHIYEHRQSAPTVKAEWEDLNREQPALALFLREVLVSVSQDRGAQILSQIAFCWFFFRLQGYDRRTIDAKEFDDLQRWILKHIDDKKEAIPFHRLYSLAVDGLGPFEDTEKALVEICFRTIVETMARAVGEKAGPLHEEWEVDLLWKVVSQIPIEKIDEELESFRAWQPTLCEQFLKVSNETHRRAAVFFRRFFEKHYGEISKITGFKDGRELFYPHQELFLTVFPSWYDQRSSENIPLNGVIRAMVSQLNLSLPSEALSR